MSSHANRYTLDEAVIVKLPNRLRSHFDDILDRFRGDFPTAYTYLVPSPLDMDTMGQLQESEQIKAEGMRTEAWIDLSGRQVRVLLNPNYYADRPAAQLQEEAERILTEWAAKMRVELDVLPAVGEEESPEIRRPGRQPARRAETGDRSENSPDEAV